MALKRYLMEGAGDGVAATTASSEASLVFAGNGNIFHDSSRGKNGLGLAFVSQPGQQTEARFASAAASTTMAFRGWFFGPGSTPVQQVALLNIRNASGVSIRFQWTISNELIIGPVSGGPLTLATGLSPTARYDISVLAVAGTTGSLNVVLRNTSGTTVGTVNTASFNSGTAAFDSAGIGLIGNYTNSYNSGWDELSLDDGSTSEIPIYTPPSAPAGNGFDLVWTSTGWR